MSVGWTPLLNSRDPHLAGGEHSYEKSNCLRGTSPINGQLSIATVKYQLIFLIVLS